MKKSLLALAVLGAFAGAASAQTAVTIYGSFDAGVRTVSNANAAGDRNTTMGSNGTYNSNRIGFKGVEDLGGGLNAHFNLESGFNSGTGALDNATSQLFNRTASVGIGSNWGSLDLGRQYTVAFKTIGDYDVFSYKYPGLASAVGSTAGVRFNNDIQYTGTFGALTARAEYALGEQAGANTTGSAKAIGLSYNQGPLALGAAYTKRNPFNAAAGLPGAVQGTTFAAGGLPAISGAAGQDNKHWTVGGAYKFGPARVAVGYADEKQSVLGAADNRKKDAWVGVNYGITPAVEVTGAYYRTKVTVPGVDGTKDLYMLSATYAFSKRTNLYALIDHAKYKDGAQAVFIPTAATQDKQTGFSVGINHLF